MSVDIVKKTLMRFMIFLKEINASFKSVILCKKITQIWLPVKSERL